MQAAIDAGLDVNRLGPRLSFFFNAHNDFLEEVAKFRAARRLWARIMRDRFGATNPRAQQLRFHTQTAGSTLTAQQPDNNIVRVAIQALAAVMGGTQSLHCNGRDEALALPTEESAAIALRTQQVIACGERRRQHRRSVRRRPRDRGADRPDRAEATALIDRIDRLGGTLAAIEAGLHPARDPGRRPTAPSSASIPARASSSASTGYATEEPAGIADRCRSIRRWRRGRSRASGRCARRATRRRGSAALDAVSAAARGTDNLVPPIIRAVEAHATVGEISDAMRAVFGEHREIDV